MKMSGTTDHYKKLIDNYFEDEKDKKRNHTKEMIEFLEKKLLNSNVEDYLKENKAGLNDKWYGRATQISPTHKLISYKYPKNLGSRYTELYPDYTRPISRIRTKAQTNVASPLNRNASAVILTDNPFIEKSMS